MSALAASRDPAPIEAPLRVALVHASDFGGGAERSVVDLHRGLRALGHESTLFVGERHGDEPGVVEIPYVRGMPGSRRAARWFGRASGLQDIYNPSFRSLGSLFNRKFDVLHFNSLWGSSGFADIGALPKLTRSAPSIITMRENWLITGHCACFHQCERWRSGCGSCPDLNLAPAIPKDGTRLNWRRKRSAMNRSHVHVVAISDFLKRLAEESPILAGKDISRIYNGIDLVTFAPASPARRAELRREHGFSENEVVVLLAGQTVEGIREGIAAHYAIAALNQLRELPGLRALAIGHSATQVAASLSIPVTTLPFQDTPGQMARCFQAADLSLVTSEVEAFGRIAAESQACGTPVVSFDTGGLPEVVLDQVGGLVVARGDTAALATALSLLIGDISLRERCSRDGMLHVEATFDQSSVAREYAAVYRQAIHRFRSAPSPPERPVPTTDLPDHRAIR